MRQIDTMVDTAFYQIEWPEQYPDIATERLLPRWPTAAMVPATIVFGQQHSYTIPGKRPRTTAEETRQRSRVRSPSQDGHTILQLPGMLRGTGRRPHPSARLHPPTPVRTRHS